MKWFDQWFYRQAKKAWDNKNKYDEVYTTSAGLLATVECDDSGIEWSDGLNILSLTGDKTMRISDDGVMQITVDSGLAVYNYILPAQSK